MHGQRIKNELLKTHKQARYKPKKLILGMQQQVIILEDMTECFLCKMHEFIFK